MRGITTVFNGKYLARVSRTVATALACVSLTTIADAAEKPRMAVMRFTNNTHASWWRSGTGSELSDMLTSELSSTKKFKLVERKEIESVVSELKFGESGLVEPSTKSRLGKIKGAQYLVMATVSSFEEGTSKKGGGLHFMGIGLGARSAKAYIAVDLKIVDVESSEVIETRTIEATSESTSHALSGSFMGIGGNVDKEEKTPVGKAIRACVINIADYLTCSMVDKTSECLDKYSAKDQKRREKTKSSITLDD
ncbi:MAG TPA: penicillin-binding protein activator LpoB [Desulfuromonadales bacterium]|nr:penicillin-binding protein activator LpoB [Desulfuromonadales bacterium]